MELDGEIDRIYGVPLDEFVRARDELAKRLRGEGDREAAQAVKALRKPTAGAWALNQAVRRRRRETETLLAAGERLRAAHEALLEGGDPATLREAMQQERVMASTLADCAEAIASETGKSGPALRERVRSTLHAATVDEDAREELAKGRFVREREAVGLGPFGAVPAAPAKGGPKRARATGEKPTDGGRPAGKRGGPVAKRGRTAAKPDRAAAAERELAARIAEAERLYADARSGLERAQSAHSAAAGEVESARDALREAEAGEREARKVLRERERELAKRARELERLRARKR